MASSTLGSMGVVALLSKYMGNFNIRSGLFYFCISKANLGQNSYFFRYTEGPPPEITDFVKW